MYRHRSFVVHPDCPNPGDIAAICPKRKDPCRVAMCVPPSCASLAGLSKETQAAFQRVVAAEGFANYALRPYLRSGAANSEDKFSHLSSKGTAKCARVGNAVLHAHSSRENDPGNAKLVKREIAKRERKRERQNMHNCRHLEPLKQRMGRPLRTVWRSDAVEPALTCSSAKGGKAPVALCSAAMARQAELCSMTWTLTCTPRLVWSLRTMRAWVCHPSRPE